MMYIFFQAAGLGDVEPPKGVGEFATNPGVAIGKLISIGTSLLIGVAGVYALFNFIFAGYSFMSADGDPGKVQAAWSKIYLSILGLAVSAGSFVLASIAGQLIYGDWNALTSFSIGL